MRPALAVAVREILAEQFQRGPEGLHDEMAIIDDLGADSLAVVELVLAFEQAFDIDIPDGAPEALRTVGDVLRYLNETVPTLWDEGM